MLGASASDNSWIAASFRRSKRQVFRHRWEVRRWNDLVSALGTEPRNLFGLTVDHLIGFEDLRDLGTELEPRERERCEDAWLVSAHIGCNRAKYAVGRTIVDRLNVYIRYVWPFVANDDLTRWEDFRLYTGVLDKLLRLRLSQRTDGKASARR